eukprot:gene14061-biopygen15637
MWCGNKKNKTVVSIPPENFKIREVDVAQTKDCPDWCSCIFDKCAQESRKVCPETLVGKLDYSPHPPVSFARLERARAAVRIAARKRKIPVSALNSGSKHVKTPPPPRWVGGWGGARGGAGPAGKMHSGHLKTKTELIGWLHPHNCYR